VIPPTFWKNVEFTSGTEAGRYAQCTSSLACSCSCADEETFSVPVTGCIDPAVLDRLNPDDAGGQYDSSGGSSGTGNPAGSVCNG